MVSKVLIFACLIAVVVADTHLARTRRDAEDNSRGLLGNIGAGLRGALEGIGYFAGRFAAILFTTVGGILGGVANAGRPIVEGIGKVVVGANGGLFGLFMELGGGLSAVTGRAKDILINFVQLKLGGAVSDVFNLFTGVGFAVGGILNGISPAGGNLVIDLTSGLMKLLACVPGSPGLRLLSGANIDANKPAICNPRYGVEFGMPEYKGGFASRDDVIQYFHLNEIHDRLQAQLSKATNGKGVDALEGTSKLLAQWLLELSSLVQNNIKNQIQWSLKDVIKVVKIMSKVIGGIGNAYKNKLGSHIAVRIVQYLRLTISNNNVSKSIAWDDVISEVTKDVAKCQRSSLSGAIQLKPGDSYDNLAQ